MNKYSQYLPHPGSKRDKKCKSDLLLDAVNNTTYVSKITCISILKSEILQNMVFWTAVYGRMQILIVTSSCIINTELNHSINAYKILAGYFITSHADNPTIIIYNFKIIFKPFHSSVINISEQNIFTNC